MQCVSDLKNTNQTKIKTLTVYQLIKNKLVKSCCLYVFSSSACLLAVYKQVQLCV